MVIHITSLKALWEVSGHIRSGMAKDSNNTPELREKLESVISLLDGLEDVICEGNDYEGIISITENRFKKTKTLNYFAQPEDFA